MARRRSGITINLRLPAGFSLLKNTSRGSHAENPLKIVALSTFSTLVTTRDACSDEGPSVRCGGALTFARVRSEQKVAPCLHDR